MQKQRTPIRIGLREVEKAQRKLARYDKKTSSG